MQWMWTPHIQGGKIYTPERRAPKTIQNNSQTKSYLMFSRRWERWWWWWSSGFLRHVESLVTPSFRKNAMSSSSRSEMALDPDQYLQITEVLKQTKSKRGHWHGKRTTAGNDGSWSARPHLHRDECVGVWLSNPFLPFITATERGAEDIAVGTHLVRTQFLPSFRS